MDPNELNYLQLSKVPVKFEPVSKITNVFFDEANKEVLSVRGGGTLGVIVKGHGRTLTYCMEHKEAISSIKFSSDHSVLAVQRTSTSVELLICKEERLVHLHTQECRTKGAHLLGFLWSDPNDLVLVTDLGLEIYQVVKEKLNVRFLKNYSQNIKWFVWNSQCKVLLLCSALTVSAATFQPYTCDKNQFTKLPKFEIEVSCSGSGESSDGVADLGERDVCVALLYGCPSVLVLSHPSSPSSNAELDVYSLNKDNYFKKTHVCLMELTGKFAVNIVDNIIIVHHQSSQCSLLFDIKSGIKINPGFLSVYPLTLPKSIAPFELEDNGPVPSAVSSHRYIPCQLYASTWVVFQPNIIIDARLGIMWELQLVLEPLALLMEDKVKLIECFIRRNNAKNLIVSILREEIEKNPLSCLGAMFDVINASYKSYLDSLLQAQIGDSVLSKPPKDESSSSAGSVVIDQAEVYSSVFAPMMESINERVDEANNTKCGLTHKTLVGIMLDYVRSLCQTGVSVPNYMSEIIISGLYSTKQFYQLHQLLQYHVLPDSKSLACVLLSLVGLYPGAEQLCLDMFGRLNTAHDEIIEILLSKNMIVEAIRYSKSIGQEESLSSRKFLEAAMATGDKQTFYSTFKFFVQRNLTLSGKSLLAKGEHCDIYVQHYQKEFGGIEENSNEHLPLL